MQGVVVIDNLMAPAEVAYVASTLGRINKTVSSAPVKFKSIALLECSMQLMEALHPGTYMKIGHRARYEEDLSKSQWHGKNKQQVVLHRLNDLSQEYNTDLTCACQAQFV